jgi:hypothetical protein
MKALEVRRRRRQLWHVGDNGTAFVCGCCGLVLEPNVLRTCNPNISFVGNAKTTSNMQTA